MKRALTCLFISGILGWQSAIAQAPDECLSRVKAMKVKLPAMMQSAKKLLYSMMPDPAAYEKTLPPLNKVLSSKDVSNLKNYGGLAEAYYYAGNKAKGESIYIPFSAQATTILGPTDNYAAGVTGDIGFLYFEEGDFAHAEPLLLSAIKQIEKNTTPTIANNLITDYLCLACMRDQQGKKSEAEGYAKKLVDLAQRMRQSKL